MNTPLLERPRSAPVDLVPRYRHGGYQTAEVHARREWIERRLGVSLPLVGSHSVPTDQMCGNVENPIGTVQMPVGIAGQLLVRGQHASGLFYVPLATTEGALVRSYERGMVTLTRAGGVVARVVTDENRVCPVFFFDDVAQADRFAAEVMEHVQTLVAAAESTTKHGRLRRIEPCVVGREVIVTFCYSTADAHGMNMIVRATEQACEAIIALGIAREYYIFSGLSSEKRASGALFTPGKGKKVIAGATLTADVVGEHLHVTPAQLVNVWHHTVLGHLQANAVGFNGQYANGLAALFIACGQDVANIVNSAVGITNFEITGRGELHASVTLPSVVVATVGGGTALGTSRECLNLLGCAGPGRARRFAEILGATLLAGELSMAAAIACGEFVTAHETYGRNRPVAAS